MFHTVLPYHSQCPHRAGFRDIVRIAFYNSSHVHQRLMKSIKRLLIQHTSRLPCFGNWKKNVIKRTSDWITANASNGDMAAIYPNAIMAGVGVQFLLHEITFNNEAIPPWFTIIWAIYVFFNVFLSFYCNC